MLRARQSSARRGCQLRGLRLFHFFQGASVVDRHDLYEFRQIAVPVIEDVLRDIAAGIVRMLFDQATQAQGIEAEAAAANAVQVFGAYGFSDEYPVERFYRNSKGASIYEGTREVHTLMQADYALGFRKDKPLRVHMPIVEQG